MPDIGNQFVYFSFFSFGDSIFGRNDVFIFPTTIEIGCPRILEVKLHSLYLGVEREICLICMRT